MTASKDSPAHGLDGSNVSASRRAHFIPPLVLSALIAGTVFLLEPAKTALLHWSEFSVDLASLASHLWVPWALGAAALSAVGAVLAARFGPRPTAVLVALYVGLWAQGNVLVWAYGPFDGTPMDWGAHRLEGVLEIAVWVGLLGVALLRAPAVRRHWRTIAAVVFALQAASLVEAFTEASPLEERQEADPSDAEHGFSLYSSDKNVIVIVLDTLQSDFFAEALRTPEFAERVPPGLVYHRNAISVYPVTHFSLQSTLTGLAVPDGVETAGWADNAALRSVSTKLATLGFESTLVSFSAFLFGCGPEMPQRCLREKELVIDEPAAAAEQLARAEISEVFAVGLFRLTPHFLKPFVYENGAWRLPPLFPGRASAEMDPRIQASARLDLEVLNRLSRDVRVADVPSRFRFLHLAGAHPPASVDRNCEWAGDVDWKRGRAIEKSQCVLGRTFQYLRALDDVGIYDDSLVFIVGDHGHPVVPIDASVADLALSPGLTEQMLEPALRDWWRGVPIFLVKGFGERGPLRTSDAPVSLCDIPASIYDALGMKVELRAQADATGCPSIFGETSARPVRIHYRYPPRAYMARLKRGRFGVTFHPYAVDGHSWNAESWKPLPELEAFRERSRRAGVPAGWLRLPVDSRTGPQTAAEQEKGS